MWVIAVSRADELTADDQILCPHVGGVDDSLSTVRVVDAFNTGHGRTEITVETDGDGVFWLDAADLICVARKV